MYLTYFFSLYPFAVPKPDFLYKTASLQQGGDISFHVENKFYLNHVLCTDLWSCQDICGKNKW